MVFIYIRGENQDYNLVGFSPFKTFLSTFVNCKSVNVWNLKKKKNKTHTKFKTYLVCLMPNQDSEYGKSTGMVLKWW